jgi:hypothetical protein
MWYIFFFKIHWHNFFLFHFKIKFLRIWLILKIFPERVTPLWSPKKCHFFHFSVSLRYPKTTRNRKLICSGRVSIFCSIICTPLVTVKGHCHHLSWKSCWTPIYAIEVTNETRALFNLWSPKKCNFFHFSVSLRYPKKIAYNLFLIIWV